MATKSKKLSKSPVFKAICVFLAVIFAFAGACTAAVGAAKIYVCSSVASITEGCNNFYESGVFVRALSEYMSSAVRLITSYELEENNLAWCNSKAQIVDAATNEFLEKKAKIIENELRYAVNNAGTEYALPGEYETTTFPHGEATTAFFEEMSEVYVANEGNTVTEDYSTSETVTTANKTVIILPSDASAALKEAKTALENSSGLDFLAYEHLVRDEAFFDSFNFNYKIQLNSGEYANGYLYEGSFNYTESEIRKDFSAQYDNDHIFWYDSEKSYAKSAEARLRKYPEILCCFRDRATMEILFATADPSVTAQTVENDSFYIIYDGGELRYSGITDSAFSIVNEYFNTGNLSSYFGPGSFVDNSGIDVIIYHSPAANYESLLTRAQTFFNDYDCYNGCVSWFVMAVLLLIACLIFIILAAKGSGLSNTEDSVRLSFIDKLPTDIHLIISAGLMFALLSGTFIAGTTYIGMPIFRQLEGLEYTPLPHVITCTLFALSSLVFMEWLCSTVRIKRAGKSWFGHFTVVRIISFIFRKIKNPVKKIFCDIKRLFEYKPRQFKKKFFIQLAVYFAINLVLLLAGGSLFWGLTVVSLFVFAAAAVFNFFVIRKVIRYIQQLDTLICCACEHTAPNPAELIGCDESLRMLESGLRFNREELERAIETATKDERMKTELITNVSHDLKTPLTAVINYVDLLKKCDINDETALGYLNVLDEKSARLKSLIEDLVEASKASAGTINLNKAALNLCELTLQAVGESAESFEQLNLDVKLNVSEEAVTVFADSQKTYRIIDNLLSNASKYSAPFSRVYISVSRDESFGIFEIKNISRDCLNITADELTERFVRGDSSRTDGGNGLGLSIARDLCALQGGELLLTIDGDLFKATVRLPLNQ